MSQEEVFIVDENNIPQQPQPRDVMIASGLWCRVASIVVVDIDNQVVLCQKRSDKKDQRPGLWVVEFGGKANPGEDCLITAQRELKEESGISCEPEELIFSGIEKSVERKQFAYCYYLNRHKETEVTADPEEVAEVAWVPINIALKNLEDKSEWYSYGNDLKLLRQFLN